MSKKSDKAAQTPRYPDQIPSMLGDELITELLARNRSRGSYADSLREFGIEVPERQRLTRKQLRKIRWDNRKDRISRAYQILRYGYYEGEGE